MSHLPLSPLDMRGASAKIERLRADVANFELIALFLKDLAGIHLVKTPKNLSLMAARLSRVLQKHDIEDYAAYLRLLRGGQAGVLKEFISAMTTNTTEFFRESRHFELLAHHLPRLIRNGHDGTREIRIWCAASSSGQEVYSLLMTLFEAEPGLSESNLKVLATDVDHAILERASRGVYTEAEVASVPSFLLRKYFRKQKDEAGNRFMVQSQLRKFVTFAPFNLMSESYPFQNPFDLVFCRNVLIYFDRETACAVTERIGNVLRTSGLLFLGHSEAGLVRNACFETLSSALYRRVRP